MDSGPTAGGAGADPARSRAESATKRRRRAAADRAAVFPWVLQPSPRPLPVVLPPLRDELLSSWLGRHASFYGVGGKRLMQGCSLQATSLRDLDLALTHSDRCRLAELLRRGPLDIQRMAQSRAPGQGHAVGPIARDRPMQVCGHCMERHDARAETEGAVLRSWMEGWRISCPVCGLALENARAFDRQTKVDPATPLLVRAAALAREGEEALAGAARLGPPGEAAFRLMRHLLLPLGPFPWQAPRLLDLVVPGFDAFLAEHYPDFQRPATMLLPVAIRVPVLAGVAEVVGRPGRWAGRLLGAVGGRVRPDLETCLRELPDVVPSASAPQADKDERTSWGGKEWTADEILACYGRPGGGGPGPG